MFGYQRFNVSFSFVCCCALAFAVTGIPAGSRNCHADDTPVRILLLDQGPDGHPKTTHEYKMGIALLEATLRNDNRLSVSVAHADEPWPEGPALIGQADCVVLFLSEGAKWLGHNEKRHEAFRQLALRKGGMVGIHWGTGCRADQYVQGYVNLFGGCHGGKDRKYKVVTTSVEIASPMHPVATQLRPFTVHEEFYYKLKLARTGTLHPLLTANIEGEDETVCWAWERPDGGRSFGFTGGHFHRNWQLPEYRRLLVQGIVWSAGLTVPKEGFDITVSSADTSVTGN